VVQEQKNASLFCCLSILLYPQLSIGNMSEGEAIFAGTVLAKRGEANIRGSGKFVTSSLNIFPEACCTVERAGGRQSNTTPPPLTIAVFLIRGYIFHLKDDVVLILTISVSFMMKSSTM
jgi:hypothetical protein